MEGCESRYVIWPISQRATLGLRSAFRVVTRENGPNGPNHYETSTQKRKMSTPSQQRGDRKKADHEEEEGDERKNLGKLEFGAIMKVDESEGGEGIKRLRTKGKRRD